MWTNRFKIWPSKKIWKNHKQKNNDRRAYFQRSRAETLLKKLRHGGSLKVTTHYSSATPQDEPSQKRSQESVADAGPSGRYAVFPAELSGVTYKDHRRKIRGAVGKGREPRSHISPAKDETIHIGGMFATIQPDAD